MPFTAAKPPPPPAPPGTGVSLSITVSKSGQARARLSIRGDVAEQVFGGPIVGKAFAVEIGRGADEGRLRIARDPTGAFEARKGLKSVATLWIAAWDLLPKSPRRAEPCRVRAGGGDGELILEMPDFCRPSAKGGKMEAEHGLGRSGRSRRDG